MAEPEGQGGKPKPLAAPKAVDLSPDEVIDDIVAHFKGLQGVTVLIGYLGDSPKAELRPVLLRPQPGHLLRHPEDRHRPQREDRTDG